QSRGITLSFHREMADSSRELVGPDASAAVSFESYPRFIKGRFQDCEGLGIERSTADSKHVSSVRSRFPGNNLFWSLLQKVVEFLELPGAWVSCPTPNSFPNASLGSVPCNKRNPEQGGPPIHRYPVLMKGRRSSAALGQRGAPRVA